MKTYVRSRGFSQEQDYLWHEVSQGEGYPGDPALIAQMGLNSLIQSEVFSLVLARSSGRMILLITGLETTDRCDFHGTPVRNSLAWTGPAGIEPYLRCVAADALRDPTGFEQRIDAVVRFDATRAFVADYEVVSMPSRLTRVGGGESSWTPRVGPNRDALRQELADELMHYRLPKEHRVAVVVTGIKPAQKLQEAGVWCGLTDSVDAAGWLELPPPPRRGFLHHPRR